MAKLAFFQKEVWHISDYKKMLIFQVFHDFDDIVFEVEVGCYIERYGIPTKKDNLLLN